LTGTEYTIVEQDLAQAVRGDRPAHPSTGGHNYLDVACCPFEIPLGARAVRTDPGPLADFQHRLTGEGVELRWPEVAGYRRAESNEGTLGLITAR
jgi:hypothetical protein